MSPAEYAARAFHAAIQAKNISTGVQEKRVRWDEDGDGCHEDLTEVFELLEKAGIITVHVPRLTSLPGVFLSDLLGAYFRRESPPRIGIVGGEVA
jgi:hypothetical protein